MRVTVALSVFLVVVIGLAVAYPSSWQDRRGGGGSRQKPHRDEQEIIEGIYPSGRQRPVSTRRSSSTSSNGVPLSSAPFYYFRSPRYVSSVDEDEYLSPYARRFKVFRRQQRDDDDDDDEDSAADEEDDEDDEPEDDEFNTPTWDEMFPREEQGSYGQSAQTGFGGNGQEKSPQYDLGEGGPPQVSQGSLVGFGGQGGGGAGGLQGRSAYQHQQRRIRPVTLRVVKPRQYNNVGPLGMKKTNRYIVYQPQLQGNRQPYMRRHSQTGYTSGPVRQWAYQPVQHLKPQYVYYQPGRTQVRQPMRARNIWGAQKRSWEGPQRSYSRAHSDTWGYY